MYRRRSRRYSYWRKWTFLEGIIDGGRFTKEPTECNHETWRTHSREIEADDNLLPFSISVQIRTFTPRLAVWYMSNDGNGSLTFTETIALHEVRSREMIYRNIGEMDLHCSCTRPVPSVVAFPNVVELNFWMVREDDSHFSCLERRSIGWWSIVAHLDKVEAKRSKAFIFFALSLIYQHETDSLDLLTWSIRIKSAERKITTNKLRNDDQAEAHLTQQMIVAPSHSKTERIMGKKVKTAIENFSAHCDSRRRNSAKNLFRFRSDFPIGRSLEHRRREEKKTSTGWRHVYSVLHSLLHCQRRSFLFIEVYRSPGRNRAGQKKKTKSRMVV